MSGPERIWLDRDAQSGDGMFPRCFEMPKYCSEPAIEYTRSDLTDARIRAAVIAALEVAQEAAQIWAPSESKADSELSEIGRIRREMWRKQDAAIRALATDEAFLARIIERAGK
jgi:hypothetical protein